MINISSRDNILLIQISKGEKINSSSTQDILNTSFQITSKNNLKAIVLNLNHSILNDVENLKKLENKLKERIKLPVVLIDP